MALSCVNEEKKRGIYIHHYYIRSKFIKNTGTNSQCGSRQVEQHLETYTFDIMLMLNVYEQFINNHEIMIINREAFGSVFHTKNGYLTWRVYTSVMLFHSSSRTHGPMNTKTHFVYVSLYVRCVFLTRQDRRERAR